MQGHDSTADTTHTIQCWPGGSGFEYRGDPDGSAEHRSLRTYHFGQTADTWRAGTDDEWLAIRAELLARRWADTDIYHCDSSFIGDLLELGCSGDGPRDLRDAFEPDAIRNLYADPSDWTAEQCREYAEENGIDVPDPPTLTCPDYEGIGDVAQTGDDPDLDSEYPETCETCNGSGEVPDPDPDDDDRYMDRLRDACREYANDNPADVMEWWRVSPWLCARLHERGHVTIDNQYGEWYGRTCSGQGLLMDGTLQAIARDILAK